MSGVIEILIVEDNPDDLELTLRTLRKHQLSNNQRLRSLSEPV
jgi:two-component system response regulator